MQVTNDKSDLALHTLEEPWLRAGSLDKLGNSFVTCLGEDAFPPFFCYNIDYKETCSAFISPNWSCYGPNSHGHLILA